MVSGRPTRKEGQGAILPWWGLARLTGWVLHSIRYRGRLRGIGFILQRVRRDHIIEIEGLQIYFNHRVAGCYDALVGRRTFGELETHVFLVRVLGASAVRAPVTFVDAGANIGEFSLDVARHGKVARVVAFEPEHECARALRISAALNRLQGKLLVRELVLSSAPGPVRFRLEPKRPQASRITAAEGDGEVLQASTVDREVKDLAGTVILKVDVEGAELDVLRGAAMTIEQCRPLIVFEYNNTTRAHFGLTELRDLLGPAYGLWRLRGDGLLDQTFEATWNCVAAHASTPLFDVCRSFAAA